MVHESWRGRSIVGANVSNVTAGQGDKEDFVHSPSRKQTVSRTAVNRGPFNQPSTSTREPNNTSNGGSS